MATCDTHCWHGVGNLPRPHGEFAPVAERGKPGGGRPVLRCCHCGRCEALGCTDEIDPSAVEWKDGAQA